MEPSRLIEIAIPPRMDLDALAERLALRSLQREPFEAKIVYLDSFDWRLFRAGYGLAEESAGAHSRLLLTDLGKGQCQGFPLPEGGCPRFAWDFADPGLREPLSRALDVRALLPQIPIHWKGHRLVSGLADLRLRLGAISLSDGGDDLSVGQWLGIEAGPGAEGLCDELLSWLSREFGLERSPEPMALHALTRSGRRPEDPADFPEPDIHGELRADAALKAILLRLAQIIEINEPGAIRDLDAEFLHDFRVAVRRSRAALGQVKDVFPQRLTRHHSANLAWLGQITGPVRDLDVYLLDFERLRENLPGSLRPALEPLRNLLQSKAEKARGELARRLKSKRYRHGLASWKRFLSTAVPKRPKAPNARLAILDLASLRIRKLFRRAIKQGRSIGPDSPAAELHELRKTCKKLRYLLEFFQGLYPPDKIRPLIRHLKDFQNHLGELQDTQAQMETLHGFSQEMRTMRAVQADTLLAMGALLGFLDRRQQELRESFRDRFADFSREEDQARIRQLFGQR